jgi:hypothetical protein
VGVGRKRGGGGGWGDEDEAGVGGKRWRRGLHQRGAASTILSSDMH